jgi:Ca2+-transporting ATPase
MIFTSIAFMQIGQALASRSNKIPFFKLSWRTNPLLIAMVVIVFLLQLVAVYTPFLREFFQVEPLTAVELIVCLVSGVVVFFGIEAWKIVRQQA